MTGINTESKVWIKILTPTHIGGAQEKHFAEGIDYVEINKEWYQIDPMLLYRTIDPAQLADVFASGDKGRFQRLIEKDIHKIGKKTTAKPGSTGEVKALIRDGFGSTYIPGSSLKGAFKSAIISWLIKETNYSPRFKRSTEIQTDLTGKMELDIFKLIKITDTTHIPGQWIRTKIFNLRKQQSEWQGGWKHNFHGQTTSEFKADGFDTGFECFTPNTIGSLKLKIDLSNEKNFGQSIFLSGRPGLQNQERAVHRNYKRIFNGDEPLTDFLKIINDQTLLHINREIVFFEKYSLTLKVNLILKELYHLRTIAEKVNSGQALIRVAGGSGFHSISGDWQFEDHTKTGTWSSEDSKKYGLSRKQEENYVGKYQKFKSRKIAFTEDLQKFYPMGFVLLSTTELKGDVTPVHTEPEVSEPIGPPVVNEIKPEFFIGTINKNSVLDAVVIESSTGHSKVRIYLNEPNTKDVLMSGYRMPTINKIVQVTCPTAPNLSLVNFKKFKT